MGTIKNNTNDPLMVGVTFKDVAHPLNGVSTLKPGESARRIPIDGQISIMTWDGGHNPDEQFKHIDKELIEDKYRNVYVCMNCSSVIIANLQEKPSCDCIKSRRD